MRWSLEEVAMHAGHEVLMEVGDNNMLIVGDPQGILVEQLKSRPIQNDVIRVFYLGLPCF